MGYQSVTTEHRWSKIDDPTLIKYNQYDCLHTAQLVGHIINEHKRRSQTEFWHRRFWPMVGVVVAMQRRGIGDLDRGLRNRARRWVRGALEEVEGNVWRRVSEGSGAYDRATFFDSHKQLGRFLFDDLGLKPAPPTKDRAARSSNQQALTWILARLRKRDEHARPVLHELFHRSRLATILERYLTIEGDPDGRVRPTIKLAAAETLRLAYAGLPGEAVQQWPPEVRYIIRARPGHTFISRDYSQLEARILALLSNDRVSLEAFQADRDIHTQNALDFFGPSVGTTRQDGTIVVPPSIRDYSKSQLYKLSYGGEAESESRRLFCPCWRCVSKAPPQVDLSVKDRKSAADRWASLHGPVFVWRERLFESIKGPGAPHHHTTPFDYRRYFMAPREEARRSIYNNDLQHCAAMIIDMVMMRLHYQYNAPITLQMHDSLNLEVPTHDANYWDEILQQEMERPVPELGGTVFPTKGGRGATWGDLK